MVQTMDKERVLGVIRKEKSVVDFLTGTGTGILASSLISPDSAIRTAAILTGLAMVGVGFYKKARCDQKMLRCIAGREDGSSGQGPDA